MTSTKKQSLRLAKESLVRLSTRALGAVAGGINREPHITRAPEYTCGQECVGQG